MSPPIFRPNSPARDRGDFFCTAALLAAFFAAGSSPAFAAEENVTGSAGSAGIDGVNGSVPTDGGDGGDGGDAAAGTLGNSNPATATGGAGGVGGRGGLGIGPDTNGGDGGDGGDGGRASAVAFSPTPFDVVTATAAGGAGGDGGPGGLAIGPGANKTPGVGGNGGNGGDATASGAFREPIQLRTVITGGAGGNGSGVGNSGGNGGTATQDTSSAYPSSVIASVRGGNGGQGLAGANGGDGGDAIADEGFSDNTNLRDGFFIFQSVNAGNGGGASGGGVAGAGGDALSSFTNTSGAGDEANVRLVARGGRGFPSGGDATVLADVTHRGPVTLVGEAFSGSGGGAAGGFAGAATLDLYGFSTGGEAVSVSGVATGINGVVSRDSASVTLSNAVRGLTSGRLTLSQAAVGGNAGSSELGVGGVGGVAGSASSTLDHTARGEVVLSTEATGGAGGSDSGPGAADGRARGGDADASTTATSILEAASASASATGGEGANFVLRAAGGDATATSVARANPDRGATAASTALGGRGVSDVGGDALARSSVTLGGLAGGVADSQSTGGSGGAGIVSEEVERIGFAGGNATATTTGTATGTATLALTAEATGGGGGSAANGLSAAGGDAVATATADGQSTTDAHAIAHAGRHGGLGSSVPAVNEGGGTALATASGSGVVTPATLNHPSIRAGDIRADADTIGGFGGADGFFQRVTTHTQATAEGLTEVQSFAAAGAPARGLAAASGFESVSYATAVPFDHDVVALMADDDNLQFDFNPTGAGPGPVSDMFGYVVMGGGQGEAGDHRPRDVTATATFQHDLAPGEHDLDLLIGFADIATTGNGFDSLEFLVEIGARPVLVRNLFNVAAAQAFFDNNVVNLGDYDEVDGRLDITFTLTMSMIDAGDSFSTAFVFGNALPGSGGDATSVPEPATAALLVAGNLLLGRRRDRTHRASATR